MPVFVISTTQDSDAASAYIPNTGKQMTICIWNNRSFRTSAINVHMYTDSSKVFYIWKAKVNVHLDMS